MTNREGTASGNPVTVSAQGGDMVSPVVTFNPIQTGSGTPSPSNPRPISAYGDIQVGINGNITYIAFDNAVYGGVLDVATGVLTVTNIGVSFKISDCTSSTTYANNQRYFKPLAFGDDISVYGEASGNNKSLTNIAGTYAYNTSDTTHFYLTGGGTIHFFVPIGTSADTEMQFTATLTTPQTVQLTSEQIALVQGTNTVTVNGNSTISFGYIAEEIATDYVYAYIPKWDKYYFIGTPAIITNYHVQYDLEEDYLASRKTEIGNTVAHIAYSSTGWDKDLTDGRIAVKGTKTIYHDSQSLGFDGGCYIVGVVNNDSNGKLGALSYYRMDAANFAKLIKYMMQDSFWDKIKQYFNGKTLDFIQSCIWVPVSGSGFVGTMQTTFYVGDTAIADYSTAPETPIYITHYPVTTPIAELGSVVSLSLGSKFQDFRDNQPYSSASLYLPGVGLTDLNINDFYESASVNVQTIFDITTGDCTYKIYDDTNQLLKTVSFNASASVSLSQVNINSAGAIAGIGGAVGGVVGLGLSAVTMNPVGMATAGVGILAGASAAVMSANQRSTSIKGTNSGRSGFYTRTASTVVVRQDTEDCDSANYIARIGRPVGQTHAISNHSGYVQCEGASVSIAGDNSERDIINNYLNTGFYYE